MKQRQLNAYFLTLYQLILGCILLLSTSLSASIAKDLIIGLKAEPTSLDPQYHAFTPNNQIAHTIFQPLVELDSQLQPIPAIANRWEQNGVTWIFYLNPHARFSDGNYVRAEDVIYSFDRVAKVPNNPIPLTPSLENIDTIQVVDDHTVKFTTKLPYPLLLSNISAIPILSKQAMESNQAEGKSTTELNMGVGLIGSGPYKFVSWKRGSHLILEKNPFYTMSYLEWNKITYKPIPSAQRRLRALLVGDVDIIEDIGTEQLITFSQEKQKDDFKIIQCTSNRLIYIGLKQNSATITNRLGETTANPFLNSKVRAALSLAIDRKGIIKHILKNLAEPTNHLVPESMYGAKQSESVQDTFNTAKARLLLAEAGYPQGFFVTLHTPNGFLNEMPTLGETLSGMWTRVGVKTDVESAPSPIFIREISNSQYDAYVSQWISKTGDISENIRTLLFAPVQNTSLGQGNYTGYHNPSMEEMLLKTDTLQGELRRQALEDLSELIQEDHPIIPLFFEVTTWMMKKDINYVARGDGMTLPQFISSSTSQNN